MSHLPLLSIKTVAGILGVSPKTIRSYIKAGTLVAVKLSPRKLQVTEEALAKFLAERSTATAASQ